MYLLRCLFLLILPGLSLAQNNPDWTAELSPFQIADNLYYVGSRDLASFLVTTPKGHILINANLENSPPSIMKNVEQLGFHWKEIKILLNGQAHFDHVAGAARILQETHALNMVMDGDADVVESGGATDFAFGPKQIFPKAHVDRVLHDKDKVQLGGVTLVAHKTAGHTRGCTTWTLRVHINGDPPAKLRDVVIAGGLTTLSQYRLVSKPGLPASYPGIAKDFAQTFAALRKLPCDLFLGAHGSYFNMLAKLDRKYAEGEAVWIDPKGYQEKIDQSESDFKAALAKQQAGL